MPNLRPISFFLPLALRAALAGTGVWALLALGCRTADTTQPPKARQDVVRGFFPKGDLRTHLEVCLSSRGGRRLRQEEFEAKIAGRIVAVGSARAVGPLPEEAFPCHADMEWYVDISSGGWDLWRLAWTTAGRSVAAPPLPVGSPVYASIRATVSGIRKESELLLSDDSGPLLVVHDGRGFPGGAGERRGPFPDQLDVRLAGVVAVNTTSGCGTALMYAVDVIGDRHWRVPPDARTLVTLGSLPLWFWNSGSYDWTNERCTDMDATRSWLVWRPGPAGTDAHSRPFSSPDER